MIKGWFAAHDSYAPIPELLPSLGIVATSYDHAEDYAAIWLYMDNSIGICFAEHGISRPGLTMPEAKACFVRMIDCLKNLAKPHYNVMEIITTPAIARILTRSKELGFITDNKRCVKLACAF